MTETILLKVRNSLSVGDPVMGSDLAIENLEDIRQIIRRITSGELVVPEEVHSLVRYICGMEDWDVYCNDMEHVVEKSFATVDEMIKDLKTSTDRPDRSYGVVTEVLSADGTEVKVASHGLLRRRMEDDEYDITTVDRVMKSE